MNAAPGTVIADKYELERCIGTGGMGEVWAAVQRPTRKRVALKFLRADRVSSSPADEEATRKRFLREARAACAVQHPNVVEIHDVLQLPDGAPVMVMEYLQGEPFEARLAREGRLSVGEAAAILARVVSAVGAAHALGIVHRDLKPDNIFLANTPDGIEVKVLDFGIAKLTALDGDAAQTGGLTNTGAMLGTPYYMSPEQAFGEKSIDHRADIWSLGIILYRALSGVLPTRGENIGQILKIIMMGNLEPIEVLQPGIPRELSSLIGRMLASRREDRPSSLVEVRDVLEKLAGVVVAPFGAPAVDPSSDAVTTARVDAGGQSTAGVVSAAANASRVRSRSRIVWVAALGAAGVVATLGVMFLAGTGPPTDAPANATATLAAPGLVEVDGRVDAAPPSAAVTAPSVASAAPSTAPFVAPPPSSSSAMPGPGRAPLGGPPSGRPLPGALPPGAKPPGALPPASSGASSTSPPPAGAGNAPSMGGVIATPPQF